MYEATILVVDDEKINRALLKAVLEKEYLSVLEAKDGKEALGIVKETDVNIILLDLMMPDMDGYDVLSILRSDPKYQMIPIVVITALIGIEDHARAIELGADGFLTKPFNKTILRAMVKNLLKQYNLQKQLMEAEKGKMFLATVVTANHEINQPLTTILCSTNLLSYLYDGDRIKDKKKFNFYIEKISEAAKRISDMLAKLRRIKSPLKTTYIDSVDMIDIKNVEPETDDIDTKQIFSNEHSGNILIVDEPLITDTLSECLIESGYNVKVSPDYESAKELFIDGGGRFDIVIIDVKEHDKDGLKLFYELKEIKKDVNVILSSSYNIKDDILAAINSGAKAFLPKPFDMSNLLFLVEKILKNA